jgi:hypothetical protein
MSLVDRWRSRGIGQRFRVSLATSERGTPIAASRRARRAKARHPYPVAARQRRSSPSASSFMSCSSKSEASRRTIVARVRVLLTRSSAVARARRLMKRHANAKPIEPLETNRNARLCRTVASESSPLALRRPRGPEFFFCRHASPAYARLTNLNASVMRALEILTST